MNTIPEYIIEFLKNSPEFKTDTKLTFLYSGRDQILLDYYQQYFFIRFRKRI